MIDPLTAYILEEHLIKEGWGDVAGAMAKGAATTAGNAIVRDAKRRQAQKRMGQIQMRMKKVNAGLKACGDKKLCKMAKHAQLIALRNAMADAKQAVQNG